MCPDDGRGSGCDLRVWRTRHSDAGVGETPLGSEALILAEGLRRQGIAWLAERAGDRPVTLFIGNIRRDHLKEMTARDRDTTIRFFRGDDPLVALLAGDRDVVQTAGNRVRTGSDITAQAGAVLVCSPEPRFSNRER